MAEPLAGRAGGAPLDDLSAWLRREIALGRPTRVDEGLKERIREFAAREAGRVARDGDGPAAGSAPAGAGSASEGNRAAPAVAAVPAGSGPTPESLAALRKVEAEALECTACGLAKTRTKVVFGSGSAVVPILFIGEAPGHDEDLSGLPFVGRAGQLLTKIIEAIHLRREDVYIANVLKCRPPENRQPLPHEAAACRHFLDRQIDLIRPKIICALGLSAAQALLGTKAPMGALRGRIHTYRGIPVIPTYHPAACLRNPELKRSVWEDVKLLRDEYARR